MIQKFNSTQELVRYILFDRIGLRLLLISASLSSTLLALAVPYFHKSFLAQLDFNSLLITTLLTLASLLLSLLCNYLSLKEAYRVQNSLAQSLYSHILSLKPFSMVQKSTGELVSLYTTDIPSATMWIEQTIPFVLSTAFPLIFGPLFLNLFYQVPLNLVYGMIFIVFCINVFLARRQSLFFSQFKVLAGQRMGLVNEWIQNIKGLKSLNWVRSFEKKIIQKRIEETENRVAMVTNGQFMNSISSTITFWMNLFIIIAITFFFKDLIPHLDLMALIWVVGVFLARPLRQLPWMFTMLFDAWTSVQRLANMFEVRNKPSIIKKTIQLKDDEVAHITNLHLISGHQHLLKNIDLNIKKGEIVALIGPVGSGKSLLMKSIMNETPFQCEEYGLARTNYLPQDPFIMSASLAENITFDYYSHQKLNDNSILQPDHQLQNKIQDALEQAQFDLVKDRMQLGLDTVIGERGLNISGGQKQRLNLARLFYNAQDLFLLDDPFSAVDVGTEKKLIDSVLELKKQGHSFLVITQRYDFLNYCDRIIYLEQGQIEYDGSFSEFKSHPKFHNFIEGIL